MEHQLHELHGALTHEGGEGKGHDRGMRRGNPLDGATFLYGGVDAPSSLHDLVHGSMVPTASLHLHRLAEFEPLSNVAASPHWRPHPWSVVLWDEVTGKAKCALNYEAGDASRPAIAIAIPLDSKQEESRGTRHPETNAR
jgi:hypothetical protein